MWYLEIVLLLLLLQLIKHWIGRHPRPTLLLWGERDGLNPPQTVGHKAPFIAVILDGFASMNHKCGVWKSKLVFQIMNT